MKLNHLMLILTSLVVLGATALGEDKIIKAKKNQTWAPEETKAVPTDTVTWEIQGGSHGVMIKDYESVKSFFTVTEGKLDKVEGFPDTDKGTETANKPGTVLLKVTLNALPQGTTTKTIEFYCSNADHGTGMAGKLVIEAPAAGGASPKKKKSE